MKRYLTVAAAVLAAISLGAYGCGERGPREEGREAGEDVRESMEELKEDAEDAGERGKGFIEGLQQDE